MLFINNKNSYKTTVVKNQLVFVVLFAEWEVWITHFSSEFLYGKYQSCTVQLG